MAKEKKAKVEKVEREFVVGLRQVYKYPRQQRSVKALSVMKRFAFKHFRAESKNVLISNGVNEFLWKNGRQHVPRKIAIKIVFSAGKAHIFLKGEKISLPEEKKEKKKGEKPVSKEEKAAEEEKEKKIEEKKIAEKAAEMAALKKGKE